MKKEESRKNEGYVQSRPIERGFVSEFFNHMLTYGGFNFDDGVMKVWGDTSLFTPTRALIYYYKSLKDNLGKDANDILYWIGRLYGKNSTILLMNKFGFEKKQLPDFINGATQDGFGFIEIKDMMYDGRRLTGTVIGKNSTFSKEYSKIFGKQKGTLDYYMAGILSGGAEPLFDLNIVCNEDKCMCSGDKNCVYLLKSVSDIISPNFMKRVKFKENIIKEKTRLTALRRELNFKFLQFKDIKFGDGQFIIKGIKGFNMASYEHVILDKIYYDLLGEKKYIEIKNNLAKIYVEDTLDKNLKTKIFTAKDVQNVLNRLKLLGFGNLNLYRFSSNNIIIENKRNPYLEDYANLFGKNNPINVYLLSKILENSIKLYFGKNTKSEIMKCTNSDSYFKINL